MPKHNDKPHRHVHFGCSLRAIFNASLTKPISPYGVGEQIRQIVEGDSWQLRYPVGPDAAPLLKWRSSLPDEQVVNLAGSSDAEYKTEVKRVFGLDLQL